MTCEPCTSGMRCEAQGLTSERIIANDGFWRAGNDSLQFLQCLQDSNCQGGGCAPHRVGALCAVCEPGYQQASQGSECTPCPSHGTSVGGTIGFSILLVAAMVVVFYVM
jgi:hypothetical protein